MNFDGPNGAQNCRFICEVYADGDDSGTPYVRYIFTMERFLGDLKDDGREGSETIIIPKNNLKGVKRDAWTIRVVEVARVEDAFRYLFG